MDKNHGYTLLESLIVLIILGAASTLAIVSLKENYSNHHSEAILNIIRQEILLARNLAITQQQTIFYCASDKEWHLRRTIVNSLGVELKTFNALPGGYRLSLNNSLHHNNCIIFTMLGMTLEQRGSFYLENNFERHRLIIDLASP